MDSWTELKNFLEYNGIPYNNGVTKSKHFKINYKIGNNNNYKETNITYNIEDEAQDNIYLENLDVDLFHTGFNCKYLNITFDDVMNTLIIKDKNSSTGKHNAPYEVIIYG